MNDLIHGGHLSGGFIFRTPVLIQKIPAHEKLGFYNCRNFFTAIIDFSYFKCYALVAGFMCTD